MKTFQTKLLITTLFASGLILLSACGGGSSSNNHTNTPPQTESVNSSAFLSGTDGWTIKGDATGAQGAIPSYSNNGGVNNSGYIYAKDDVSGGVWYFVAPPKFHGDHSDFLHGTIEFYLSQESKMQDQFNALDIVIENGSGEQILYNFTYYPSKNWTKYKIVLDSSDSWLNKTKNAASNNDIVNVLSDIKGIKIRGEYETGNDIGGLDNFEFKPYTK